jgi:hypothetical protein
MQLSERLNLGTKYINQTGQSFMKSSDKMAAVCMLSTAKCEGKILRLVIGQ